MAVCVTNQVIWVPITNATTPRYQFTVPVLNPGVQPSQCTGSVLLDKTEYQALLDAQTNFGWDQTAFDAAVTGGFTFFAIGLGIGLIVQAIKRARTP